MRNKKIKLGVNLDHIAFIKKSRDTMYPNLADAVRITEEAGADSITIHLREDRRHVQDKDAIEIRECAKVLNFEMANTSEMIDFALKLKPDYCCIVPEKRDEKTTEGGLILPSTNTLKFKNFSENIEKLSNEGIKVSLFIDPNVESVQRSKDLGANIIELHTGHYANEFNTINEFEMIDNIVSSAEFADKLGLLVNAGHGLNYENLNQVCKIQSLNELNIGHSIISQAVFTGLKDAIVKIISIINNSD